MVLLELDWYRESKEFHLNKDKLIDILHSQPVVILLVLESDREEISKQNPPKKIFRPSEFFKNHTWIKIYPQKNYFLTINKNSTCQKNILFLTMDRLVSFLDKQYIKKEGNLLLNHFSLKELSNIQRNS